MAHRLVTYSAGHTRKIGLEVWLHRPGKWRHSTTAVAPGSGFRVFTYRMNDRFLSMQLFARVARTGSFSLAGRELGLSQPSASRIVAMLEKRVGVPLLRRSTRGVKLTDAGAEYLLRAEAILAALDEADHAVRGSGELRGSLRVACSLTFANRSILPLLAKFASAHPRLRVEFLLGDHRQDILAEGVDIAFRMGAPIHLDAVAHKIGINRRLLAAAPSYLEKAGIPRDPDDLSGHALIVGPAGRSADGWTFRKAERTQVAHIEGRYVLDSTEATTAAAVNGLGIVSTGDLACGDELHQGSLVRVLPDWEMGTVDVQVVFPDGRMAKPAARTFAKFIGLEFQNRLPAASAAV
jgi:DNA-binding transcriptional LysR family regulator